MSDCDPDTSTSTSSHPIEEDIIPIPDEKVISETSSRIGRIVRRIKAEQVSALSLKPISPNRYHLYWRYEELYNELSVSSWCLYSVKGGSDGY